jgi:hypothetical protein
VTLFIITNYVSNRCLISEYRIKRFFNQIQYTRGEVGLVTTSQKKIDIDSAVRTVHSFLKIEVSSTFAQVELYFTGQECRF